MKRLLFAVLAVSLLLTLCACDPPVKRETTTGETADASWWGTYDSGLWKLGIVNYNGTSFRFVFYSEGDAGEVYDGVAAVNPDDIFNAYYENTTFELTADSNQIAITFENGSEYAFLDGLYTQ